MLIVDLLAEPGQEPCSRCPAGSQRGLISRLSGVHVLLGWILCHEHGHNPNK
jgi:hypothetical protein